MSFLERYLVSFARYMLGKVVGGHKNYEKHIQQYFSFNTFPLKRRKIFRDITQACQEDNSLTYEEFLLLDQFGKHGYHRKHNFNGNTPTAETWARAALTFCKNHNITHIIDFGAGDGSLALGILKESVKRDHKVTIHAVEVSAKRLEQIKIRLKNKGFSSSLGTFTTDIEDISLPERCLVIFSYSLDSIPPELFVNTTSKQHVPDTMIGIQSKDNKLVEIPLLSTELTKKSLSFQNGLYHKQHNPTYDLSYWKLSPMQRAWIPLPAMNLVSRVVEHIPHNSYVLVIDEFAPAEKPTNTHHLCMPKDLTTFDRFIPNFQALYKDTAEHLLYYPTYLATYLSFFKQLGLTDLAWGIDFAFAYYLVFDKKIRIPHEDIWDCYAILGKKTKKQAKKIILDGPWQKSPVKYHIRKY